MRGYDFSELLRIQMNYVAGWIGYNCFESRKLEEAFESMDIDLKTAFLEYKKAYYSTDILRGGFGYNVYHL